MSLKLDKEAKSEAQVKARRWGVILQEAVERFRREWVEGNLALPEPGAEESIRRIPARSRCRGKREAAGSGGLREEKTV